MPAPTVLVVDDDPDILDALSEILEAEGYGVTRARNGQEALDRLSPDRPNLHPPGSHDAGHGRLGLRPPHAPAGPEVADLPIIVLSADRNVGARAREIGAVGHLAKPFELADLLSLVPDDGRRTAKLTRSPDCRASA